jgi:NADH:ubiquinone oxidoreductase subunit 3 (subunit A)
MKIESLFFIVNFITVGALSLSIIYTAGIVWRVEKKLDISYKFFLSAIIFLFAAEILSLLSIKNSLGFVLTIKVLQMLFTLCFLFGVLLMRNITQKVDTEIKKDH